MLLTHKKNFGPHDARFISLHANVIKLVRKCVYSATILRDLLLLPVGIQIVKHVFHSSVQLVFEISPPPNKHSASYAHHYTHNYTIPNI